jgi:hypothetical protein
MVTVHPFEGDFFPHDAVLMIFDLLQKQEHEGLKHLCAWYAKSHPLRHRGLSLDSLSVTNLLRTVRLAQHYKGTLLEGHCYQALAKRISQDDLSVTDLLQIIRLARHHEDTLLEHCYQELAKKISQDNVQDIVEEARGTENPELEALYMQFVEAQAISAGGWIIEPTDKSKEKET